MNSHHIVKIDSYDGRQTFLHCGDGIIDHLYCVMHVHEDGRAEIIDNGYRSLEEAAEAWPEAGCRGTDAESVSATSGREMNT